MKRLNTVRMKSVENTGVSKDTLKRYINNKCIQLNEHDDIHSETFAMASFDNLDKNQSYAMVGTTFAKVSHSATSISVSSKSLICKF
jgi:hypothetical protein